MPTNFMSEAQIFQTDMQQTHRTYDVMTFPHDAEMYGDTSMMIININAVEGSKYLGGKGYNIEGEVTDYEYVEGAQNAPVYQRAGNASGARLRGSTRRISDAIALYMPNEITSTYTSNFEAANLGAAGNMMDLAKNISAGEGPTGTGITQAALAGAMNTATRVADVTGLNASETKKAMTMTMTNPYTEIIFNGVENRRFSFTFRLIPRNAAEQASVEKIVDTLKFHRAPEYKFASEQMYSYWLFPSEFDIMFLHRGQQNEHIFKISTCVMENFTVDHKGENHFATHADGAPVITDLTMDFIEVEALTKSRIAQGF